jgi:hypothetical protein
MSANSFENTLGGHDNAAAVLQMALPTALNDRLAPLSMRAFRQWVRWISMALETQVGALGSTSQDVEALAMRQCFS